jgi:hypothetical protein
MNRVEVNHVTGSNEGAYDMQEVRRSLRKTGSLPLTGGIKRKTRRGKLYRSINKMTPLSPANVGGEITDSMKGGAKRRGVPVKTLKKLLKKAGLKTSGKKAALTRRAKKARLMKGGEDPVLADNAPAKAEAIGDAIKKEDAAAEGGRKRRKSRGLKLF